MYRVVLGLRLEGVGDLRHPAGDVDMLRAPIQAGAAIGAGTGLGAVQRDAGVVLPERTLLVSAEDVLVVGLEVEGIVRPSGQTVQ